MSAVDPRCLRALFDAAVELPPAERFSYLAAHCPEPHLRRAVEGLLAADAAVRAEDEAPAVPPPDEPWPNLTGFAILGELGRGGMGVVYQARQAALNRVVAVKRIRPEAASDPERLRRFRVEAEAIARINHPNILSIYDIREDDGQPFLILEHVDGGSLAERLDGTPWAPEAAASLVEVLARGLHEVHRHAIVHRDLKPGNVLLPRDGGPPKIADFGLARLLDDARPPAPADRVAGTPRYMAPEVASGQGALAGPTADIYALGAILYELLTGRPPFDGSGTAHLLAQIRTRAPVPPRQLRRAVPRDLETVCLKCLAKEPAQRYATAEQLADDLERWRTRLPIAARRPGAAERLVLWARRRPAAAVAGLLLPLLLSAGAAAAAFGVLWWELGRGREREQVLLYRHRLTIADQRLREGEHGKMFGVLLPCPERLRGWEWHYLARQCRQRGVLEGHRAPVVAVRAEAGTSLVASASFDGTVCLWDPAKKLKVDRLEGHAAYVRCVALSPDGKWVASGDDAHRVCLWDRQSGRHVTDLKGHVGPLRDLDFDAEGKRLASASLDGTIRIWDVAAAAEVARFGGAGAPFLSVRYRPDGGLVAGDDRSNVWAWGGPEGSRRIAAGVGPIYDLAVRPGGEVVAAGERLVQVNPGDGRVQLLFHPQEGDVNGVCLLPDGRVAAGCDDGLVVLLGADAAAKPVTLLGHRGRVSRVCSWGDGAFLASAGDDETVRLWKAAPDGGTTPLVSDARLGRCVAVGRNGLLATGDDDGTVRVWELATGRPTRTHRGATDAVVSLAFRPDGAALAWVDDEGHVFQCDPASNAPPVAFGSGRSPSAAEQVHRAKAARARKEKAPAQPRRQAERANWDAGREWRWLTEAFNPLGAVAYSPDGRRLASVCLEGTVTLWDTQTGNSVKTLDGGAAPIVGLCYSPDGRLMATAGLDSVVRLWDVAEGRRRAVLLGHNDYVLRVAFAPDGSRLASASKDGTVRLWDVSQGKEIATPRKHNGEVVALAYNDDGTRLASAGLDRCLKVWDATSGELLLTRKDDAGRVVDLRFAPGGRLVGRRDRGAVEIWDGSPFHVGSP